MPNHDPDITPAPVRVPELDVSVKSRDTPRMAEHLDSYPTYEPPPEHWTDSVIYAWDRTKKTTAFVTKMTPHIFNIIKGITVRNMKTTVTAVLGAIFAVAAHFGVVVPESFTEPILAVTLIIVGLFARDAGNGSDAK